MTAPALVSETAGNITASGTSHAITLPATVGAGDRLVAALTMRDSVRTNTWTWPAGWTELIDTTAGAIDLSVSVAWRIADGTEDGGTVTVTSSSTEKATCKSWCFSGAGTVYATIGSLANTANPNPPNLAPGSGDWHWIAICAGEGNRTVNAFPSGYSGTGYLRPNVVSADDATLGWARLEETGVSSQDPGTFTLSSAQQSYAITVGVIAAVPTITSITPATSATYPYPGELVTVAMTGYSSAPLSANCTLNGVGITLEAGATTSSCSFYAPALSTFVSGGTHAATRWNTNYTLTIANASNTANFTIQVTNPTNVALTNDFAARSGTQYYAPAGSADGDDFYVTWDYGGGNLSAAGAYFLPTTLPARGQIRWYDVSAVSWQALAYTDVFSADEPAPEQSLSTYCPDSTTYTNLIFWSNEFGHSSWTKTRASVVYDTAEVTPRKTGAWTLVEDGTATNTHYVEQAITPAASTVYTARAVVKASNRTQAAIALTGAGNSDSIVIFDVSTGTFVATSGTAPTGYEITELEEGSGWWVISLYWTTTSTASMTMRVYAAASGSVTFSGASQESLLIADAMIHTGSTVQDYVQTERATMASNKVLVRSMLSHNLVAQSNTMNDAAWTKTRSSISGSIALNAGATGGWQSATIYRLLEDATASNTHFVANTADGMVGNPADLVTCRFVAQGDGTRNHLAVRVYGDSNSNYFEYVVNLSDGTTYSSAVGGTGSLHSMTATLVDTVSSRPVYEVKLRGWPTTTSDTAIYQVEMYNHNGTTTSYNGTGTNGVYVGKVHIYNGYETTPNYVETTTATQPFAGTITTATINGISATVASANRSTVTVTLPGVDEFDDAGTHAATRWYVAQDLVVGDGVTTDTGSLTFEPCFPNNFGTLTDGFNASSPTGAAVGDDGYIRIMSGDGTTVPALMNFTPSEASTIRRMVYDVSGSAWLAYTSESVTPTSPGDSSVIYSVIKNVVRSIQIQTVG